MQPNAAGFYLCKQSYYFEDWCDHTQIVLWAQLDSQNINTYSLC